jgi:aconitate hydratase
VSEEQFRTEYARIFDGDEHWNALDAPTGAMYAWDEDSTYVQEPPFFRDLADAEDPAADLLEARVLVKVGDSVTTDHISPAGAIKPDAPAGAYLLDHGVAQADFNSYGSRRGNHNVMVRGTFANVRLRNELAPGTEGPWTTFLPDGDRTTIYEAALRYAERGVPLLVLAGKEYGSGSSRDWAAKGPALLGVRAVLAETYERIHRSNLVGMGVLPLQYPTGESAATLGLDGTETYAIRGLSDGLRPGGRVTVETSRADGSVASFRALVRIDQPAELEYYRDGGVLRTVVRHLLAT